MKKGTIDIIIPVYKPDARFHELIERLLTQSVKPENIFVMQTMVEGESLLQFAEECIHVRPVLQAEFDHGTTRDAGAKLSASDYILMMTQDAMPADSYLLEKLLEGFKQPNVGIVFARQLAREEADITERLTREHNYPSDSMLKTREDEERLGIKTYFCSDVCAMYDRVLYEQMGGFVKPAIFNEDMIMTFHVMHAGYAVYYNADAKVIHSHSYTCMQQFHRNFDLGVSQSQYHEIFENISSEKAGAGFAGRTIWTLCRGFHFGKAFYFAWQCAFRLFGYRLGKNYERLSKRMILRCTGSPWYWKEDRF